MNNVHIGGRGGEMNKSVTSKELLISICKELVREEGIAQVNIRSLAEKSQISIGAVYNYFSSKEELLSETIFNIWSEIFHFSSESYNFDSLTECFISLFHSIEKGKKLYPNFFTEYGLIKIQKISAGNDGILKFDYWEHIKQGLRDTLDKDTRVRNGVFNNVLTPQSYIDYIFELFLQVIAESMSKDGFLKLVSNSIY